MKRILRILGTVLGRLFNVLWTACLAFIPVRIIYIITKALVRFFNFSDAIDPAIFFTTLIVALLVILIIISYKNNSCREKIKSIKDDFEKNARILKKEYEAKERKLQLREQKCREQYDRMQKILSTNKLFSLSASLSADVEMYVFDDAIKYLQTKKHPAKRATVNEVKKEIKAKAREYRLQYKEMLYKYEALIKAFPEIQRYVDEEEIRNIAEYTSYSDYEDGRDRVRDFLSDEEWKKLTVTEKNQLALDRYIERRKASAWAVGRDYEMSCAFVLRKRGYQVTMNGIENGKSDLGRDLIVRCFGKDLFGEYDLTLGKIFIIQCKYWKKEREIRENVMMQLYGTTIAYKIENAYPPNVKIIPVLMIPDFSEVSTTALKFAQMLNIRIKRENLVDFPRIKCNINGDNKIYHLPFDQQYDRTHIKNKGELYAYSVEEAEKKGFRRAQKWQGNSSSIHSRDY